MPGGDHVREKLYLAVNALALGEGSLRERVVAAWLTMFHLHREEFIDEESRVLYSSLSETLGGLGSVDSIVAAMSDDQVRRAARAIFELDSHVGRSQ